MLFRTAHAIYGVNAVNIRAVYALRFVSAPAADAAVAAVKPVAPAVAGAAVLATSVVFVMHAPAVAVVAVSAVAAAPAVTASAASVMTPFIVPVVAAPFLFSGTPRARFACGVRRAVSCLGCLRSALGGRSDEACYDAVPRYRMPGYPAPADGPVAVRAQVLALVGQIFDLLLS
ncbi:hypothetical protein DL771_007966 [Monosporascus sp. 5C6A]|nr:hypothetical protein DL771_007966 [Monosporascus sp. 5C6A]